MSINNKYVVIRNVILVAFCGYCVSFLFPLSDAFWKYIVILLEVFCIYECSKYKFNGFERSILIFEAFVIFNAIITMISGQAFASTLVSKSMLALPSFVAFGYLGKKGVLTDRLVVVVIIVFTICGYLEFYHWADFFNSYSPENEYNTIGINIFLFVIPLLLFIKKRLISVLAFFVCITYLLIGAKRGLILCAIVPSFLFITSLFKGKKSLFHRAIIPIIIVALIYLVSNLIESYGIITERYNSTMEGNSSGRDVLYSTYYHTWKDSNPFNMLFGFGTAATERSFIGLKAHSDWIEILYDYGIFGIILYFVYFINLIKLYVNNRKSEYANIFLCIVWICGLKSIFSFVFFDSELLALAVSYGYVVGKQYNTSISNSLAK